jgi:ethanolamine ammonia-lyase small subunit
MTAPACRVEDSWAALRGYTDARIALGRSGSSLPTQEVLGFRLAHARARDAVLLELDLVAASRDLEAIGVDPVPVVSRCKSKVEYLQRPDLGRRLSDESRVGLDYLAPAGGCDLAIVVADGLSSVAVRRQAPPLLSIFLPYCSGLKLAPICLAKYGRVALADEIGSIFGAKVALILIGERPGLSSPDSLGAYLTYGPEVGTTDERRNCVSNIRPAGLRALRAATKLDYLVHEALSRGVSGIGLKDEQAAESLAPSGSNDRPDAIPALGS